MFYFCYNIDFSLNNQVLYTPSNSFITLDHGTRKPIWCHTHAVSLNVQLVSGSPVAWFLHKCPDSVTYVKTEGISVTYILKKLQRQNLTLRAVLSDSRPSTWIRREKACHGRHSRTDKVAPSPQPLWFRLEKKCTSQPEQGSADCLQKAGEQTL